MTNRKTAIVTGSTSGIGLAIAEELARSGCNIMLNGLGTAQDIEALRQRLASETKMEIAYSPADMSKPAEIAALVTAAEVMFGQVDIVVNNAGIQTVSPIEDFPVDRFEQIIAINMASAWQLTRLTMRGMKERKWGRFVNIASAQDRKSVV